MQNVYNKILTDIATFEQNYSAISTLPKETTMNSRGLNQNPYFEGSKQNSTIEKSIGTGNLKEKRMAFALVCKGRRQGRNKTKEMGGKAGG